MTTIHMLLTVALHHGWPVTQLDVANAFLHGDLADEVYMKQPRGFLDSQHPQYVCKLRKSIYGLKQSPRQWFHKLTHSLQQIGFTFSQSDPSLLLFHQSNARVFVLIYVDDILVTGNDSSHIQRTLSHLKSQFSLKQLGDVLLFLSIQVIKTTYGYFLNQTHYTNDLISTAGFSNCKPATSPARPKSKIPPDEKVFADPCLFRKLAGSLQYLSITRPDISFAINSICQHMHQPRNCDYLALKRLLRYIKGTAAFGLPITRGSLTLRSYSDADWAADPAERKSISGVCTFLGSTLISWSVKKQTTVARSSIEAEYRSLAVAIMEVLWLRRLALDFSIPQNNATTIHCDNTSAIALANNPVLHARTKHIEIDHHFIRHHITHGNIKIAHICSSDQIADILTKSLPVNRFNYLCSKLTICSQNG
ncbi:Retrovirus-related Pol polyprotein from transposon TNT 1-94 [Dendrobium catenatum]|uniref:Retrovirus-related Pol polyprotein from transposon TNT 1-94 n=1 Tax=Dendrobium catenatum TaxID=906689 RepID=A0A2I0VJ41_9ASPA|nr:Retrovirus-related Pol polyprotein from transposon TNT 1-94 [Dendrobium catenatum]